MQLITDVSALDDDDDDDDDDLSTDQVSSTADMKIFLLIVR